MLSTFSELVLNIVNEELREVLELPKLVEVCSINVKNLACCFHNSFEFTTEEIEETEDESTESKLIDKLRDILTTRGSMHTDIVSRLNN